MIRIIHMGPLCTAAAALLLVLAAPAVADAQRLPPGADTTLAGIVESVRTSRGGPHLAIGILAQRYGPQPQAKLDALADSLVAMAVSYRDGDGYDAGVDAFMALHAISAAGDARNENPYPGAFDALVRIHEGAERSGFQSVALSAMTRLADTTGVLPYLIGVATSDKRLADAAVDRIASFDGGLEILRQLYLQERVTHPWALSKLRDIAVREGWPINFCRGMVVHRADPETGESGEEVCLRDPRLDTARSGGSGGSGPGGGAGGGGLGPAHR